MESIIRHHRLNNTNVLPEENEAPETEQKSNLLQEACPPQNY